MKRKPRIAIMTPVRHGTVHHEFASSLAGTMRSIPQWDFGWFTVTNNTILPDARSQCLAQARAWDADKYVFIDDDISWTVQEFVWLCAHPVKAVTGYYVTRKANADDEVSITIKFKDDNRATDSNGLIEVEGAGFGFIRFDREIFEAMEGEFEPMHDTALPDEVNRHYANVFPYSLDWDERQKAFRRGGEDIHFCRRIAAKGYPLYLDPKIQPGHNHGALCMRADITKLAA